MRNYCILKGVQYVGKINLKVIQGYRELCYSIAIGYTILLVIFSNRVIILNRFSYITTYLSLYAAFEQSFKCVKTGKIIGEIWGFKLIGLK